MRTRGVFYHRTSRQNAARIIRDGFRDGIDGYLTETVHKGVWLSDRPLDENDGARGDTLLLVASLEPWSFFAKFEWIEEGKAYREWLVPASVINDRCAISYAAADEE